MTFVRPKARILELSTTSGSGPLALAGSPDNSYNTFSAFMAVGDQTYVTVIEPGVAFWTGIATYSAANQLTLTTVEEAKGTLGAGAKEVMAAPLASTAAFREDIAGAIVTGGTSTAYTVASYRKYDSLSRLDGNIIAFTPHATNGPAATLNVDGLGAKPLRLAPGVGMQSNVLILGTPYTALFNNADGAFYLHALGGNAYGIPLAAGLDYWGATTPSSAFAFPAGQLISRTTYAALFALIGTTYGAGDGSTTFNLPDKSGRVSAMREGAATRLTTAGGGIDGASLGASGGSQTKTLVTANLPAYTPGGTITNGAITINNQGNLIIGGVSGVVGGGGSLGGTGATLTASQAASTFTGTPQGGTSAPFAGLPPLIVCNYIMRVI